MPTSIDAPGLDQWLVREDEALKAWLQGIVVSDQNNSSRPVRVWFGQPDPEIRGQQFPYITIDLLDIDEDKTRVMSGFYGELSQYIAGVPDSDETTVVKTMFPTPMDLIYQVTSWSRVPRHDRAILAQVNQRYLHPRFAQMAANDNTSRRIVLDSFAKRDTVDEEKKRLFRNVWTVTVKSEFLYWPLDLIERVQSVTIDLETFDASMAP